MQCISMLMFIIMYMYRVHCSLIVCHDSLDMFINKYMISVYYLYIIEVVIYIYIPMQSKYIFVCVYVCVQSTLQNSYLHYGVMLYEL